MSTAVSHTDARQAVSPTVGFPCRACGAGVTKSFVDLGLSPLCQTHVAPGDLDSPETFYPLHVFVCQECWLAQLREYVSPEEIFSEYAYFSSFSESWVRHAERFCALAMKRFHLGASSRVVEVASNDGYLLQHFVARGVPCLGVEPAANVAREAVKKGVPTEVAFFGETISERLVAKHGVADLIVGNNVFAHTPHLNDFILGLKRLLAPRGAISLEFPHLARLILGNQFDTIYHEHFSYFSLLAAEAALARHGLAVFDVEELPTHGGSLRVFACHADSDSGNSAFPREDRVDALLEAERSMALDSMGAYEHFAAQVRKTKRDLLAFLIDAKRREKRVVGYGAAGKGNTLLNYCGIRGDYLDYIVDRNPYKQGKFTPGTRIPILDPSVLAETRPDYILLLPWNLKAELAEQLAYTRDWGAKLVVPIPELEVF
jgi:hypothetical protein